VEGTRRRVDACREECGALGGLLLTLALDHAGDIVRKRLLGVFGQVGREAMKRATSAANAARWATESVDALKTRVRELERKVSDLTHGVGERVRLHPI